VPPRVLRSQFMGLEMDIKQNLENNWVYVEGSGIHGRGVFAKCDIPSDERIMEYLGDRISKNESYRRGTLQIEKASQDCEVGSVYIFELNEAWDIDGNIPENIAKFANHSCDQNCEAYDIDGRIFYVTCKPVKKGEEILIDYGYALEHFAEHPCRCGVEDCVGFIVGENDRAKLKKMRSRKSAKYILKDGERVEKDFEDEMKELVLD